MTWVKSEAKASVEIHADVDTVRKFLLDVPQCGRLMPSVKSIDPVGDDIYHYKLEEFSNGGVTLTPDYQVKFDVSDPAEISWEPYGEHNFKVWGVYRTAPGNGPNVTTLELDTQSEVDLPVPSVMVPLVRPFASRSNAEVTKGFLKNIKSALESDLG